MTNLFGPTRSDGRSRLHSARRHTTGIVHLTIAVNQALGTRENSITIHCGPQRSGSVCRIYTAHKNISVVLAFRNVITIELDITASGWTHLVQIPSRIDARKLFARIKEFRRKRHRLANAFGGFGRKSLLLYNLPTIRTLVFA